MTERSESERAELVAELKEFLDRSCINDNAMTFLRKVETALRRLAAQDQAIEAALVELANMPMKDESHTSTLLDARKAIAALRHNAPPVSGAGESVTDLRIYCGDNPLKWAEEFCQIKQKQGWSVADIDENLMLGWFANAIEQSSDVRGCSALPDHGGADAGVVWRSISEDTRWIDGRDVVLLANDMEVQARYCPGEWCDETPSSPREYSGAVWSCFDDQFQLEIEECSEDPSEWCHDGATHWRPTSELPPTALPDHGGADAGVREIISAVLFAKWSGEAKGWPEGGWSAPDWGAWRNRTKLNPVGLSRTAFEEEADFLLKEVQAAALSKPAPVAANASADGYRNAIDEVLVTRFIGVAKGDAKAELNQIIKGDVAVALDPRVSSSAQALIDSGRNASAEARLREALKEARLYVWLDSNVPKSKQTMLAFIDAALSHRPAPVAANASAEARLREALECELSKFTPENIRYMQGVGGLSPWLDERKKNIRKAILTHPHASDCDKQGER